MERPTPNLAVMGQLLITGIGTLTRSSGNLFSLSQNVSAVVGVPGGGAACGAALFGVIFALPTKTRI